MKIKNNTQNPLSVYGQEIQPGEYYSVEPSQVKKHLDGSLDSLFMSGQLVFNNEYRDFSVSEYYVNRKIERAMEFGRSLMAEYGTSNVLAGLTMEQIQDVMAKTIKVQAALNTGSLYIAISEINLVPTDETVVTVARITEFRNRIEDYLGIPRT